MGFFDALLSSNFLMGILIAVSIAAVVFTIGAQFSEKNEIKTRIKRVAVEREKMRAKEMERLKFVEKNRSSGSVRGKDSKKFVKDIVDMFSLKEAFVNEKTAMSLQQAGYRMPSHIVTYVFLRLAIPICLFVFSFIYLKFVMMPDRAFYLVLVYAFGIGIVGAYLPVILLKNKMIKRQKLIKKSWPDCLDLLLLCVESGMSIEEAFKRVSGEMTEHSPELAEELMLTNAELSFLEKRADAYRNLGERTGLDGVKSVMMALIQSDKYGTSVGQSLRVMSEEGREERMMEAEKKAASLPPKLTVPLIVFFLPVLFIVVMAPAMIQIFGPGGAMSGG